MKKILVLGAGYSTPYLIDYLLEHAEENGWYVTLGDLDLDLARRRLKSHPRSTAVRFDVTDADMRDAHIAPADVVVNMLPPAYQMFVAVDCVKHRVHMVSASYEDIHLDDVNADASRHGVLILSECGFDPGIDHMSATEIVARIRSEGGVIRGFRSYGTGVPEPEFNANPLRYAITWNPRNVVMSGEQGATYLVDGHVKMVPFHEVFQRTWAVEVPGIGTMEAYPNRDSLYYKDLFGLRHADTMIRGTLRYPGWCETWLQLVRLGLPNETMRIPHIGGMTYRDLLEMFLPLHTGNGELKTRMGQFLGISPTGTIMQNLEWLGLFSDTPVASDVRTTTEALTRLVSQKLRLGANDRDMVAIVHDIEAEFEGDTPRRERITSTLVQYGTPNGTTAMAKAVGLPAAIAVQLILTGSLPITGCQLPTHPTIYTHILAELRRNGFEFTETRQPVSD